MNAEERLEAAFSNWISSATASVGDDREAFDAGWAAAADEELGRLREVLRRLVYEAEHVWPASDPTRAHCPFCVQAAPQQGEPPAHLDWCRVLEARAALAPRTDQQEEE